jgi:hypothetical protein
MYSFEELKTSYLTQKNFDPGRIPFIKSMGGWVTTLRRLDDARCVGSKCSQCSTVGAWAPSAASAASGYSVVDPYSTCLALTCFVATFSNGSPYHSLQRSRKIVGNVARLRHFMCKLFDGKTPVRILVIGGSNCLGAYLPADEKPWPETLEQVGVGGLWALGSQVAR